MMMSADIYLEDRRRRDAGEQLWKNSVTEIEHYTAPHQYDKQVHRRLRVLYLWSGNLVAPSNT